MRVKTKAPLISIIVPVYNIENYLRRCVDSILTQEYYELQIILVDDGSTDESGRICDQYAAADRRVETIHKQNGGPVSARKAGLEASRGEYIGFVDGDDWIERGMFRALLERLTEDQSDFVHSGYRKADHSIYGVEAKAVYSITESNVPGLLRELVFDATSRTNIAPSLWSKLFRRELIADAFGEVPDTQFYGEDLLCLCHCMLRCKKLSVTDEAYYYYTVRSDSICHERRMTNLTREYDLHHCLCELFERFHMLPEMRDCIDKYFLRGLSDSLRALTGIPIPKYRYPDRGELRGKRIAIWGAGEVGQDYYAQMSRYSSCAIAAWADSCHDKYQFDFCEVIGIEELSKTEFDVLVIGVLMERTAGEIRAALTAAGIPDDKIRWSKPQFLI